MPEQGVKPEAAAGMEVFLMIRGHKTIIFKDSGNLGTGKDLVQGDDPPKRGKGYML